MEHVSSLGATSGSPFRPRQLWGQARFALGVLAQAAAAAWRWLEARPYARTAAACVAAVLVTAAALAAVDAWFPPRHPYLRQATHLLVAFLAGVGLRPAMVRARFGTRLIRVLDRLFSPGVDGAKLARELGQARKENRRLRKQLRRRQADGRNPPLRHPQRA